MGRGHALLNSIIPRNAMSSTISKALESSIISRDVDLIKSGDLFDLRGCFVLLLYEKWGQNPLNPS